MKLLFKGSFILCRNFAAESEREIERETERDREREAERDIYV